jgi:hypothetical protein
MPSSNLNIFMKHRSLRNTGVIAVKTGAFSINLADWIACVWSLQLIVQVLQWFGFSKLANG